MNVEMDRWRELKGMYGQGKDKEERISVGEEWWRRLKMMKQADRESSRPRRG